MGHTGSFPLCAAFLLLSIFIPSLSHAQHPVDVSGTVRDEMGKAVGSAHLSALPARSKLAVEAVSGADGAYVLNNLVPGSYTVTVQATGFAPKRIEFTLTGSADKATLDVTLAHDSAQREAPTAHWANAPPPRE